MCVFVCVCVVCVCMVCVQWGVRVCMMCAWRVCVCTGCLCVHCEFASLLGFYVHVVCVFVCLHGVCGCVCVYCVFVCARESVCVCVCALFIYVYKVRICVQAVCFH